MRVMIDTNIFISALLFPSSLPAKVLCHVVDAHELVLCPQILKEIREVIARKRPDLWEHTETLLKALKFELAIATKKYTEKIQDPKDTLILEAALSAHVDVIISGDKHFLSLDLRKPATMTAANFWECVAIKA